MNKFIVIVAILLSFSLQAKTVHKHELNWTRNCKVPFIHITGRYKKADIDALLTPGDKPNSTLIHTRSQQVMNLIKPIIKHYLHYRNQARTCAEFGIKCTLKRVECLSA